MFPRRYPCIYGNPTATWLTVSRPPARARVLARIGRQVGICLALTGGVAVSGPLVYADTPSIPPEPTTTLSRLVPTEEQATVDARPLRTTAPLPDDAAAGAATPHDPSESEGSALLNLQDLQQMAWDNHPAIARAQALVNAARGNWVQVGLAPNPVVGYEGQQIGSRGLAEQDGVFVEQEFVRGGKLALNRAVASREVAKAERELWIVQQQVSTDIRLAYYQVAVAQQQLELTEQLLRVASDGMRAAETLFSAKEVSKPDVLQAELEVENAEILLENARNRHAAAWVTLANAAGQPSLAEQPVAFDLDTPAREFNWEATLQDLLARSPEIATASAEVERARWAVERARAEPRPNVTVRGLVNARDNGIGGDSDGGISVGLPVPLWNRNQGAISQTQCELVAAIRNLERLQLELGNRLAPVYERYSNARNQVERYQRRILPAAAESLELTRRSYAAGEVGFVSLLTAQRTYFQTSVSYLDATRELRLAEAEIEGFLLSGALQAR